MEILIRDTPEEGARVASRLVRKILSSRSNPVLGLATGGTPLRLYREMIRMYQAGELSFQDCTSFNLDEYVGLPPEDERSYHHYMRTHLFDQVDMDPEHIHLPNGCAGDLRRLVGIMNRKSKKAEESIYRFWELEQMGTSVSTNLPVHWLPGPGSRFSVNRPCVIMQYILIVPRMFHVTL